MHNLNVLFTKDDLSRLFIRPLSEVPSVYDLNSIQVDSLSPLSYIMMMDYKMYLPDDILQKVDKCSMSQSLEAREPYLDHRIIEYVATLPDQFKYHNGIKKHILKEICYRYVPKNLMDRPKMGFSIPINKWLGDELRELLEYYLADERIRQQAILTQSTFIELN